MNVRKFQETIWNYYEKHGRHDLPWRPKPTRSGSGRIKIAPYKILVSEIMLQQTQVDRVVPKYKLFVKKFGSFKSLAEAPQREVLQMWSGLGYNRRALNLHKTAKIVHEKYHGRLPKDRDALLKLPGIGLYTASAIRVFAYNIPDVMIETNIRSVYLHHFFTDTKMVSDKKVLQYIEKCLDKENPREWYGALMDYGTHLKQAVGNKNTQSAHYTKQSKFKGSNRELRGNTIKALTQKPVTIAELTRHLGVQKKKALHVAETLEQEGFIKKRGEKLVLA